MPAATRVLVVDSDAQARAATRRALRAVDARLDVAEAGGAADLAGTGDPCRLAVVDADLPGAGLRDTLAALRRHHPDAAVVVLASGGRPGAVRAAVDGGAHSVVIKGCGREQLAASLAFALAGREERERARARDRGIIESLAAAVEAKDLVTSRHLHEVSRIAVQIARQMAPALADSEEFLFGCLLHDVGKIGVPERILGKPGPLTDREWLVMRRHPETGARVIRPLGLHPVVREIVLHHHERWDGGGYPDGRRRDAIPLPARIFSLADALDAMTATRPYRRALPPAIALERVRHEAGRQFDPQVVAALDRGVEQGRWKFPTVRGFRPFRRSPGGGSPGAAGRGIGNLTGFMSLRQKYRLRTVRGRERVVSDPAPDAIFVDPDTGDRFDVVAKLLPLAPSPSELPWAVENLRFCNWCDQLAQKDLNDCPHCGRRMVALPGPTAAA